MEGFMLCLSAQSGPEVMLALIHLVLEGQMSMWFSGLTLALEHLLNTLNQDYVQCLVEQNKVNKLIGCSFQSNHLDSVTIYA